MRHACMTRSTIAATLARGVRVGVGFFPFEKHTIAVPVSHTRPTRVYPTVSGRRTSNVAVAMLGTFGTGRDGRQWRRQTQLCVVSKVRIHKSKK